MNTPSSAILSVLIVGCVLIAPIMTLPIFRAGRRAMMKNRLLGVPLAAMFALLFWPTDPGQAFSSGSALDGMRVVRVVVMVSLLLWLAPYFLRAPVFLRRSALNLYLLYIVICIISAAYAPDWREALWKSIELLVVLTFASVLRHEIHRGRIDLGDVMCALTLLVFFVVFFALVGGVLYPSLSYGQWSHSEANSISRSMGGIVPRVNPNSLGQLSAMILLVGVVFWVLRGRLNIERILLISVGSAGLFLANARTSIAAVALILFIFLIVSRRLSGLLLVGALAVTGLFALGAFTDYLMRGQDMDLFLTLSGRTWMWGIAWESIRENPWLGLGYAGHKTLDIVLGMEYSTIDNTYLESLVNVGFVGTSFLVVFVGLVIFRVAARFLQVSASGREEAIWLTLAAGFIWIMLVRSLAGPSFQAFHWNLIMLLAIAVAAVDRHVIRESVSNASLMPHRL